MAAKKSNTQQSAASGVKVVDSPSKKISTSTNVRTPAPQAISLQDIEQQIRTIDKQLSAFEDQVIQMQSSVDALTTLQAQSGKKEILVPIAEGIFIPASVDTVTDVIMNVGSQVAVKKPIPQTIKLLQTQIKLTQDYQRKLYEKLRELSAQADEIVASQDEAR